MGYNNTIAIISNTDYAVEQVKSMLVLLRDVDKVECYNYDEAETIINNTSPCAVILYAENNDISCLNLLKRIRTNQKTRHIPVILYPEYENTDFIIEAFDNGITDIITPPLKDYDLVIRVIWAIQRSENFDTNVIKDNFLRKIGIIDDKTGFYKENYSLEYLETLISRTQENKQKACIMLIHSHPPIKSENEKSVLINAMKNSVRINDAIVIKDEKSYYIYLSKCGINGVRSVYERISSGLGPINSISARAIEVKNESFGKIIEVLNSKQESVQTGIEMVTILDSNSSNKQTGIIQVPLENIPLTIETSGEKPNQREEKIIETGTDIIKEIVKETGITPQERKKSDKTFLIKDAETDFQEPDESSRIVYKQAWAKKLNLVAEPLLKKYAMKFQAKYKGLDANLNIDPYISFLCFEKNDVKMNFQMIFDEPKTVRVTLSITVLESEIESETLEFEVTEFDFKKLDIILKTITKEYENYISEV